MNSPVNNQNIEEFNEFNKKFQLGEPLPKKGKGTWGNLIRRLGI